MSSKVKTEKTYRCPVCQGTMHLKAGGRNYFSYVCEICGALLQVKITEKLMKVNIGEATVLIDNKEVADILKREHKQ